jgi:hypothetical protein
MSLFIFTVVSALKRNAMASMGRITVSIAKATAEIGRLATSGLSIELVNGGVQPYALVRGVEAPSPPWDRTRFDILIPIPLAYDLGTPLDGFYLGLPYTFNGGDHTRVSGQVVAMDQREWKLVSWHYPDGKPFDSKTDTIESHIVHCRGFFLERGAVNARS